VFVGGVLPFFETLFQEGILEKFIFWVFGINVMINPTFEFKLEVGLVFVLLHSHCHLQPKHFSFPSQLKNNFFSLVFAQLVCDFV